MLRERVLLAKAESLVEDPKMNMKTAVRGNKSEYEVYLPSLSCPSVNMDWLYSYP